MPVVDPEVGLSLRHLRDDDADFALMGQWLSDARVLALYGGAGHRMDAAAAKAKYRPRVLGESPVIPCMMHVHGVPMGYLQYYPVLDPADYQLAEANDTWAIDLFIGEPALWGKGLGRRALRVLVSALFEQRGAARVIIDPAVTNTRAIRAYEAAGFEKIKVLRQHEEHDGVQVDCWLMAQQRPVA